MQKKGKNGFYYFWTGAILICLVLVLFSLIFVSCTDGGAEVSPTPETESSDAPETAPPLPSDTPEGSAPPVESGEPSASPSEGIPGISQDPEASQSPTPSANVTAGSARLGETEDMGQEYVDKFIFLGDSTTYGLSYYEIVDKTQVWTPSNGTLTLDQWNYVTLYYPETGEDLPLTELLTLKQPEYLCITLGVNGISYMDEDYFKDTYTALVQKVQELSPGTKIICNSIYPVTAGYEAQNNGINNVKIEAANLWIESVAEATGTYYLDSASVLKNDSQVLPDEYTNGDGLHLNPTSFGLVINYLRTHGC